MTEGPEEQNYQATPPLRASHEQNGCQQSGHQQNQPSGPLPIVPVQRQAAPKKQWELHHLF
ncbi:MAG: hypothetical protein IJV62_02040 [Eggerthellaceae bacterium]|nr:hypothetical protein [Eggerthellaceae bacterium]